MLKRKNFYFSSFKPFGAKTLASPLFGVENFPNLINNKLSALNTKLNIDYPALIFKCHVLWNFDGKQFLILNLFSTFAVQGSHRDSTKQNKDLAMLTQHSTSNNLNNPSSSSVNKNAASASDADVNRSGPYFDVAASKNVRIQISRHNHNEIPFTSSELCEGKAWLFLDELH